MNYKAIQRKNLSIIKKLDKKVRLYYSKSQLNVRKDASFPVLWVEQGGTVTIFTERCDYPNKTMSKWKDIVYLGVFLECQLQHN